MARIDVVKTEVFTFDELSDAAKERARDWFRTDYPDYDWWDSVYEIVKTAGEIIGIEIHTKGGRGSLSINHAGKAVPCPSIWFSGFSSQGDGACFEGSYRYKKGWRAALLHEFGPGDTLNELLSIGRMLQDVQRPYLYKLEAQCRHSGHYYHSGCMAVDVGHADDPYRDIGGAEFDLRDALREFADWIYAKLEQEYDWLCSDEQVDESIRINEYEFTEDGHIY